MRPKDVARGAVLRKALGLFHATVHPLPGIQPAGALDSFVEQIVESMRRIEYVKLVHRKPHSPDRSDPSCELFDPLMAAGVAQRAGAIDEASWLVFLSVHFGKHRRSGWRLVRDVYGRLRSGRWDWAAVSAGPASFSEWLHANQSRLMPTGKVHFGNHRKYESLRPGPRGTAAVVASYVAWVLPHGGHDAMFEHALREARGDAGVAFDKLYCSMSAVKSFGRMARFDYLTMLGKFEIAEIEPAISYLDGATGPLKGARLLFGGSPRAHLSSKTLDRSVAELGTELAVGMQVMEDALCNWQKSPQRFVPFRG